MFARIAAFEFRYQLKNPIFWIGAGLFFLLTFGSVASDTVQIGATANVHVNSPFVIAISHFTWAIFFMFVAAAFIANVVVRDDDSGFAPIIRSTRVRKFDYLYGRFLGAFVAAALAFAAVPLALLIGSAMPWIDPEKVGPTIPAAYAYGYFVIGLPALFVTGALFFALATATRSMMWTYVGVVGFLVLYLTANGIATQMQAREAAALLDPFGGRAYGLATQYWTAADRNRLVPAVAGAILWNRLIWTGVGVVALVVAYAVFRFETRGKKARRRQAVQSAAAAQETQVAAAPVDLAAARARPQFDARTAWTQAWARTRFDMGQVFRSPAFFVLLGLGVILTFMNMWFRDLAYGVPVFPVTRLAVQTLRNSFTTIPVVVAIYYAGELVWRERDRRTEEIIDSTPVADWAFAGPKVLAVSLVLIAMMVVAVVTAMLVQTLKGYTHYEIGKYLWWYVVPDSLDLILLAVLAVFVQALVPHKFVGWLVMVLYIIGQIVLGQLGFQDYLYQYGSGPTVPLSDMNGLGLFGRAAWWFRAYWSAWALVVGVLTYALWPRGSEGRLRPRLRRLAARLSGPAGGVLIAGVAVALATGGFIYLNTHVWNPYRTDKDDDRWLAAYEKALLPFEKLPQPKIVGVTLSVDLHPEGPYAVTRGLYVFQNRTGAPVRELHVRFDRDLKVQALSVDGARPKQTFDRFNYRIFSFDTPMQPGERRRLSFTTWRGQRGFKNDHNTTEIVGNGSFLNNAQLAPLIGMDRSLLLRDRAKRRKYGLPPELRPPKLEDDAARAFNALRRDSDWVTADITVSTSADQIPMAPGYKVSDRVIGGRRVAEFRTEAPIMHFFSIQSARWAVRQARYKGVDLSIYYHPAHAWNVDRMIHALQVGLDYNQANFSPYQFRQARILEFPAYRGDFAQSFANTIPYSENLGWIYDFKDPSKIDMVTYITAHELGHQWWGHQEVSAFMQGDTALIETLAQYSALMTMEKLYGPDQIRKFLKYELDSYLRSRGGEAIEELPLIRVEDQPYIHYRKGSLVMYRLKDELGEAAVNRALRALLQGFAFKGAPYPSSKDLVTFLRHEAGPDLRKQQLITDLFERITLYDLKAVKATSRRRADGRYDVSLTVQAGTTPGATGKEYDDGKGRAVARPPLDEWIDVGVFDAKPDDKARVENGHIVRVQWGRRDVLAFRKLPIRSGTQTVTFTVDRPPRYAAVDPYNKLIDRNSEDNWTRMGR